MTTPNPTPEPKTIPFVVHVAPECSDVLKACDKALDSAHKAIEDQQKVIDNLKIGLVDERAALDKANQRSIFENPGVLILLGVVGGMVLHNEIRK